VPARLRAAKQQHLVLAQAQVPVPPLEPLLPKAVFLPSMAY
jgi:hypothetical protein